MSLIYINDKNIIQNNDSNLEKLEELSFDKDDIITASLNIKDVVTYTLKLPKSTPQEQLITQAEIQFYENAGLDLNKKFITNYLIRELDKEEVYLVEAIGVDEETLHTKFQNIVEKTKHIDFISLSMLSFCEFYELYDKKPQRDAFVYLDNNQSFISVYENGEYLYSKTLNSLNSLLKAISLDYDNFVKLISTKGVNKEEYEMDEFLIASEIEKFFSEYFMAINNRLSYGKTIFYLDNIDNIYFYTPFEIKGIDTLKNFWDLSGINFEIIPIEEINFLDKLNTLYNTHHFDEKINFSIFPRPPKFYKTKTFALSMVVLLTAGIFGGDFWYRQNQNNQIKTKIDNLNKQIKIKQAKLTKLELINKQILLELKKYNNEIDSIEKKKKVLKTILEKSLLLSNMPKVSENFVLFSELLKRNKLQSFILSKDNNNSYKIGVYTDLKNRKFIGLFMDDLLKNNYKNIRTDKISNFENDYYMSVIRFKK